MTANVELLPLPEWAKRDDLGELVPSEVRAEMGEYARTNMEPLIAENERLRAEVSELRAARIAYAKEFPATEDGDPDTGNIHANIRALKARAEQLWAELDEQCRLHAIGMERELKLINERDRLLKEVLVLNERAERLKEALEMMVEMVEMNGFGKAAAMDTARAALAKENL